MAFDNRIGDFLELSEVTFDSGVRGRLLGTREDTRRTRSLNAGRKRTKSAPSLSWCFTGDWFNTTLPVDRKQQGHTLRRDQTTRRWSHIHFNFLPWFKAKFVRSIMISLGARPWNGLSKINRSSIRSRRRTCGSSNRPPCLLM